MRNPPCFTIFAALVAMVLLPASGAAQAVSASGVDVAAFIKRDIFRDIKISPDGDYLAATVPMADRTGKDSGRVSASVVDSLPADDKFAIVAIVPFSDEPWSRAEKMDVYTGRREVVARAPVQRDEWVGPLDALAGRSATDMAGRIKVPVFLAAGGEDTVAPPEHTQLLDFLSRHIGGAKAAAVKPAP